MSLAASVVVVVVKGKTNAPPVPSAGEALGVGVLDPPPFALLRLLLLPSNGFGAAPSPAAVEDADDGLELGLEPAFRCCCC